MTPEKFSGITGTPINMKGEYYPGLFRSADTASVLA
jgi:hypothetical protein